MKTLNVSEAASFLRISADTLKKKAARGLIPGAKVGKAWIFTDEALEEHVRSEIARQTGNIRGFIRPSVGRRLARTPPPLSTKITVRA